MSDKTLKLKWQIGALRPFLQDPNFSTDDKLTLIEEVIQKTVEPIQKELKKIKEELAWYESDESGITENLFRCGQELEKIKKEKDALKNVTY